jgi:hypothetical protein
VSPPAALACRNCGGPAGGAYCPSCGQETALHPPTAREFLHEFIGHYVALEGKLWRTLKALVFPGRLTNEYFAGRRRQYVLPLRLYLTASVVFFLVAKVLMPSSTADLRYTAYSASANAGNATLTYTCKPGIPLCDLLNAHARGRFGEVPKAQFVRYIQERLVAYAPYAMFFLLPVFALLTRAAYWNRPRNYGEHLVFAFHVHTFVFLVAALVAAFQSFYLVTVPAAVYVGAALGKVFGGRTLPSTLRFLFVFLAYFAIVLATLFAMIAAAVFV